jgi:hypothetical protein
MAPLLRNRDGYVRLKTRRVPSLWSREAGLVLALLVVCALLFTWVLLSR